MYVVLPSAISFGEIQVKFGVYFKAQGHLWLPTVAIIVTCYCRAFYTCSVKDTTILVCQSGLSLLSNPKLDK